MLLDVRQSRSDMIHKISLDMIAKDIFRSENK